MIDGGYFFPIHIIAYPSSFKSHAHYMTKELNVIFNSRITNTVIIELFYILTQFQKPYE